jgi:uncharacterized protein YciI
MWYMIYSEDVDNSLALRMQVRDQHINRLQALKSEGRLMAAGPLPAIDSDNPGDAGFTGSLLIVQFDSLEQAKDWANVDPYIEAGVYKRVTVKPFKKVLP